MGEQELPWAMIQVICVKEGATIETAVFFRVVQSLESCINSTRPHHPYATDVELVRDYGRDEIRSQGQLLSSSLSTKPSASSATSLLFPPEG